MAKVGQSLTLDFSEFYRYAMRRYEFSLLGFVAFPTGLASKSRVRQVENPLVLALRDSRWLP